MLLTWRTVAITVSLPGSCLDLMMSFVMRQVTDRLTKPTCEWLVADTCV